MPTATSSTSPDAGRDVSREVPPEVPLEVLTDHDAGSSPAPFPHTGGAQRAGPG